MTTAAPSTPGVPDDAPRSDDGFYWWDGSQWNLVPAPVAEPEPERGYNPWGEGFDRDSSGGDPILTTRPISETEAIPDLDQWAWAMALAPIVVAIGFTLHPLAGAGAYALTAIVSAVAVWRDSSQLREGSYVEEKFGKLTPYAVLILTPVAVPFYLFDRKKALEENETKVLTWGVGFFAAAVFAVTGLLVPAGSLLGHLTEVPDEQAPIDFQLPPGFPPELIPEDGSIPVLPPGFSGVTQ